MMVSYRLFDSDLKTKIIDKGNSFTYKSDCKICSLMIICVNPHGYESTCELCTYNNLTLCIADFKTKYFKY